jgi:hypothetical protein
MAVRLPTFGAGRALQPEPSSDTHFGYWLNNTQGLVQLERLGKLKQIQLPSIYVIIDKNFMYKIVNERVTNYDRDK